LSSQAWKAGSACPCRQWQRSRVPSRGRHRPTDRGRSQTAREKPLFERLRLRIRHDARLQQPALDLEPNPTGAVSRFRRRPSDASRASSSSRQKCAGPMRRSDRGASHRDRGWRQLPHRPCRAFSLAQPPTRYEDLIQPAIGHCLRRTWSVGDNTGGAGVAPGAISCRVLPSAASYLSMVYQLLGALAVLGSGVRAPSAPPKFRRQRLEAGDADGGSPAS